MAPPTAVLGSVKTGALPQQQPLARLPGDHRPVLLVLIDAEEEFDWNGDFRREHDSVTSSSVASVSSQNASSNP